MVFFCRYSATHRAHIISQLSPKCFQSILILEGGNRGESWSQGRTISSGPGNHALGVLRYVDNAGIFNGNRDFIGIFRKAQCHRARSDQIVPGHCCRGNIRIFYNLSACGCRKDKYQHQRKCERKNSSLGFLHKAASSIAHLFLQRNTVSAAALRLPRIY